MFKAIVIVVTLLVSTFNILTAQEIRTQQGVIFKANTAVRISRATIINKRSKYVVSSNDFGIFRIIALKGDSISIEAPGFKVSTFSVGDFSDAIIYLKETGELQEVIVRRNSVKKELEELSRDYQKKGIYYKGRPGILTLIGSPLTFFYERFSKTGKNAKRAAGFAKREIAYNEIARRFNDFTIKATVPVTDEELATFKSEYLPTLEQTRRWSEYDLMAYIRKSYTAFKIKRDTIK